MTRRIRAVLFDFDGTLAPNLDLPGMRREVLALTDTTPVPKEVYADRYIVEIIDAASAWLMERDAAEAQRYFREAHDIILRIELDAAKATEPFPDVPAYLQGLQARGVKTAVVTRNCRQAVLTTYPDVLDHVDQVLARDDVENLKPDPRHLQQALTALGVQAEQAAMVGDGQMDMHTGQSLGLYCVGVLSGSSDADALRRAGADVVLAQTTDFTP